MYERALREPGSGVRIEVRPGETIDSVVRRFKKAVQSSLILIDCRQHERFVPKAERRKVKSRKARRRQGLL